MKEHRAGQAPVFRHRGFGVLLWYVLSTELEGSSSKPIYVGS